MRLDRDVVVSFIELPHFLLWSIISYHVFPGEFDDLLIHLVELSQTYVLVASYRRDRRSVERSAICWWLVLETKDRVWLLLASFIAILTRDVRLVFLELVRRIFNHGHVSLAHSPLGSAALESFEVISVPTLRDRLMQLLLLNLYQFL